MPGIPQWSGTPSIKGSTEAMRMALLTTSLIGLQFTWNVEMTYCTPYLLELGLTKSKISLVWIAGPLSGLIMQPIVGVVADRSTSRWGRRRPFMVAGTVLVSMFLLLLGWTKEVVKMFSNNMDEQATKSATIALAVFSIYGIDFAINAVQGSCRGLIVDTLPIPKQQMGSSWASRMVAVGSLVGYGAGAIDLGAIFGPMLGDTQFKQLTTIAALCLCLTVGVTSWAVTEKVLLSDGTEEHEKQGPVQVLSTIANKAMNLPRGIAAICFVQFWAWIGWFPFLFYSTTWVGEIYLRYEAPAEVKAAGDLTGQVGRIGSTALIAFSIITFLMSVVLPWFVRNPEDEGPGFTPRPPQSIASFVTEVEKYKPSLLTAWTVSHCIFAGSMMMAPFVQSLRSATLIVAACGVSWAISCWAPFTFLGIEINRLAQPNRSKYGHLARNSIEMESPVLLHLNHALEESQEATAESSGAYLGIMNLYTTLPQFVGTFISWGVFTLLEPAKSTGLDTESGMEGQRQSEGPNAIAVCLFIGALSATVAAMATRRLKRYQKH
ncbi:sucrose transport protein-like protein [Aaosphaeria arxii CBS 175.79]|uniref:Sucrose transport protein-like protein n=1 Tax=Aaosphaeria arxii CBS 175.79 TaxID=1450172 RepID=A0A6A5XJ43_9PLEO|nr:sucrose transport protein-like protein [Aaosphaeria arxii CBS 175.79]KAF2012886.1 sucrose transport protein-like protein [Aaosphaeria arxii CBS 175.79]